VCDPCLSALEVVTTLCVTAIQIDVYFSAHSDCCFLRRVQIFLLTYLLDGVKMAEGKGHFLEVFRPTEKHCESPLRCMLRENQ